MNNTVGKFGGLLLIGIEDVCFDKELLTKTEEGVGQPQYEVFEPMHQRRLLASKIIKVGERSVVHDLCLCIFIYTRFSCVLLLWLCWTRLLCLLPIWASSRGPDDAWLVRHQWPRYSFLVALTRALTTLCCLGSVVRY